MKLQCVSYHLVSLFVCFFYKTKSSLHIMLYKLIINYPTLTGTIAYNQAQHGWCLPANPAAQFCQSSVEAQQWDAGLPFWLVASAACLALIPPWILLSAGYWFLTARSLESWFSMCFTKCIWCMSHGDISGPDMLEHCCSIIPLVFTGSFVCLCCLFL